MARRASSLRVPLEQIHVGNRLRKPDPAKAAAYAVSFGESGQIQPILLRPLTPPQGACVYDLVVGATRHLAAGLAGWTHIEADIRPMTDAEARLVEIDENLCKDDLSPLQRAVFIAARFDAWRARYPERVAQAEAGAAPKRGRPTNSAKFAEFLQGAPSGMGFRDETAVEVGLSPRTVANAFSMFRGLAPALRTHLDGTWVGEKEGLLRQLASVSDPVEQSAIADQLLSGATKSFSDARALAAGNQPAGKVQAPADETLKAFRKLWGAASPSARALILSELQTKKLPAGWAVTATAGGK